MNIGVLTVAYNEERFIRDCIEQFRGVPSILNHLVLVSGTPWHGQALEPDKTEQIAEELGAAVCVATWPSEADQRNMGVQLLSNMDWILVVDADEYYSRESIERMIEFLSTAPLPAYGIGRLKTYWKDKDHVIDPEENGGLIVAIKPSVHFVDKRCIDSQWSFLPKEILMHHYSYVRSDEEMWKKITSFEHQHEIVRDWYTEVWKKWTPDMENLHPVNPTSFKKAVINQDGLQ